MFRKSVWTISIITGYQAEVLFQANTDSHQQPTSHVTHVKDLEDDNHSEWAAKEVYTMAIAALMPPVPSFKRYEASAIAYNSAMNQYLLVFDSLWEIAMVNTDLVPNSANQFLSLSPHRSGDSGHEGIAMDLDDSSRFFLLSEAEELGTGPHPWYPVIRDAKMNSKGTKYKIQRECYVDLPLSSDKKGLEGLDLIRIRGIKHFIGLCEGNNCNDLGVQEKRGMLVVMQFEAVPDERFADHGIHCKYRRVDGRETYLPETAKFEDYADIRHRPTKKEGVYDLVIVSQQNSAFWLGTVDWKFGASAPPHFEMSFSQKFPVNAVGKKMFCNVEGVEFRDSTKGGRATEFIMVSDSVKKTKDGPECGEKDQSVHIIKKR